MNMLNTMLNIYFKTEDRGLVFAALILAYRAVSTLDKVKLEVGTVSCHKVVHVPTLLMCM